MIFSFDLDQSVLFTRARLTPQPETIPVEYRLGEPFGFMTPAALQALRDIQRRAVCLVNTLRGLEQARRVCFVDDGSCRYLSLQNGLYLLRDGVPDRDWADSVARTVAQLPIGLDQGVARVTGELPGVDCLSKRYEYLAVFFVGEAFDDAACGALAGELAQCGWELVRQRKKLYLSPLAIHKGAVLERVLELEGADQAVGFGDSGFDLPFLRLCQVAYAPKGCELEGQDLDVSLQFSAHPAQLGTEEVLSKISSGL